MGIVGGLAALLLLAGGACAETVRILAIRVDFQPDTLTTTTGDGSFESAFRFAEPWAVDPLPHDSLYFDSHLRFLDFYWKEVSSGAVDLWWEIWPQGAQAAYRLPKPMWEYHWNESDERTDGQLAMLFRDAWTAADEDPDLRVFDGSGTPRFDAFIVFHAGVGQDFGGDSTPHDIPSAFLAPDPNSGAAPHESFMRDVPGGPELAIRQGLILPEGENHGDFEHGMAGLLVLQFGHQLGLPNLYDSRDGSSVIGKWGLMDQGSANLRGLLPARPEAWSRAWLGWEEPDLLTAPMDTVFVASPGGPAGLPRVVRLPLAQHEYLARHEYLLVENRHPDPQDLGWTWGRDRAGRWARLEDNLDITFQDTLGVAGDSTGVLVEVGNLDFDLPGGGLLIWHVDERAANADNVAAQSVNDDPELRGVDLEEGDGVQDIGRDYGLFSPRGNVSLGGLEDPWQQPSTGWYLANQHYPFSNVTLAWDTEPSTNSNDGLFTGLRLDQFGPPAAVGRFRLSWDLRPSCHGDSLALLPPQESQLGARLLGHVWTADGDTVAWLSFLDNSSRLFGRPLRGEVEAWTRPDGYPCPLPPGWQDGLRGVWHLEQNGEPRLLAQRGDSLALFRPLGDPLRFTTDRFWSSEQPLQAVLVAGGGVAREGDPWSGRTPRLWVATGYQLMELDPVTFEVLDNAGSLAAGTIRLTELADGSGLPGVMVLGDAERLYLQGRNVLDDSGLPDGSQLLGWDARPEAGAAADTLTATAVLRDFQGATLYRGHTRLGRVECENVGLRPVQMGPDPGLELAFLTRDGRLRIFNQAGVELLAPELGSGVGLPLTGSRTDDGGLLALAAGSDRLAGLAGDGNPPATWPRVWIGWMDGPVALPELGWVVGLAYDGSLVAWEAELQDPVWTQPRGWNGTNRPWGSGAAHTAPVRQVRENPAFIWPNPAADVAHVRFWLEGPARVVFTAYDTAGDRVARLAGSFQGPGEQELDWDLDGVAPGAYFGVLEAQGQGADRWTRRIPCAVLR